VPLGTLAVASSRALLLLAGLVALVVLGLLLVVVFPVIWSRKRQRRESARAVLDRIFRREVTGPRRGQGGQGSTEQKLT